MYTSPSCEKSQLSMTVCSDLPQKGFTIDKFIVQELVVVGDSILGNPFNRRSIFSLNLQNGRRDLQQQPQVVCTNKLWYQFSYSPYCNIGFFFAVLVKVEVKLGK